ncbi:toll/interleukin-1 receptor domain-containing protein [Catenulispora sp. NL8]|uniref:Toll/interleukin-1 receptor domain-containing protein n=1 Tax=Catenulispora pinistramenti TaxID=2705254 RepID=A0ABS5L6N5_9ACTN|nr:toll/interleukin-1 receptor domain-containing protein [Catenulispora pinistramenti]MBS2553974.1 toll/interleukin-1 receptor domain-containing protein [Catenulispora pinistramenti]
MHEIFVNYRTNDAHDAAFAIQADLVRRFGRDKVFYASSSLNHGERFDQELIREARKARVLLAVIGPDWLKHDARGRRLVDDENDWVRREIAAALQAGTTVIPILVGRTTDRLPADLPPDIKDLVNFNYRRFDHREAEAQLPQIAAAVQEVVTGLVDATRSKPQPEPPAAPSTGTTNTSQSGGITTGNQSGRIANTAGDTHGGIHMSGDTHGDVTNYGGAVNTGGGTFIGHSNGPVHTGSGSQFNPKPAADDDPDDEK